MAAPFVGSSAAVVVWATSLVPAMSTTMRSQTSLDVGSFKVRVFNFNQGVVKGGPEPFQFFEATKRSAFSTNAQLRFSSVVLGGILGSLRLTWHTRQSLYQMQHTRQGEGPCWALCQLKKPFQGSEPEMRELLGGTEDNSVSPITGH